MASADKNTRGGDLRDPSESAKPIRKTESRETAGTLLTTEIIAVANGIAQP